MIPEIFKINNKPFKINSEYFRLDYPLWTPARTTTQAWWDMSDTNTITESGGLVSQVDDKSGNDRHMIQTNASYKPVTNSRTRNGRNVVEFDTSNWLEHTTDASLIFPISTNINVFMVASRDVSAQEDIAFYVKDGPAGVVANTTVYDGVGSGSNDVLEYAMMFDDFVNYCRSTFQDSINWVSLSPTAEEYELGAAGQYPIFISRTERGSTTDAFQRWTNSIYTCRNINSGQNNNVASTVVLGGHGSLGTASRRLDGVICEVVVTHGALSDTDRYKYEGYLAWKWGSVDLLPVGHPYKLDAPRV